MKKIFYTLLTSLFIFIFTSCDNDQIDINNSIFDSGDEVKTPFEDWLYSNYTQQYNIGFKYKFEDIESDHKYDLAPAEVEKSEVLAQIVKKVWLEAYDEVADIHFTRKYVPRIIHLVGSPAYNEDGSIVLGTAEGGTKVTLYMVNNLDVENIDMEMLNFYYFHTMHHEFAHILHQTKNYDEGFKLLSEGQYVGGDWIYRGDSLALSKGFISPYSMMNYDEDFVELYSYYVTNTEEWWNVKIDNATGDGKAILNQKMDIVKDYFKNVWEMDLDTIRKVVLRRSEEVKTMDFITF